MEYIGKAIIGFEESATVRQEFERLGWDAWSCDLQPSRIPGKHYQCDIRDVLGLGWDIGIFHPPCTRLCNSGVRWLNERDLWVDMREAAELFRMVLTYPMKCKAVENPIPHKYAVEIIGRKYDQIIQPWMFGHGETKATCLWLEGLPKLKKTCEVSGREHRIWKLSPGPERSRERSVTFPGIARAMAEQWTAAYRELSL